MRGNYSTIYASVSSSYLVISVKASNVLLQLYWVEGGKRPVSFPIVFLSFLFFILWVISLELYYSVIQLLCFYLLMPQCKFISTGDFVLFTGIAPVPTTFIAGRKGWSVKLSKIFVLQSSKSIGNVHSFRVEINRQCPILRNLVVV